MTGKSLNHFYNFKKWFGKLPSSCEMPFMMLEELQKVITPMYTVFENHRKSRIQHCEQSELRLHFGNAVLPQVSGFHIHTR